MSPVRLYTYNPTYPIDVTLLTTLTYSYIDSYDKISYFAVSIPKVVKDTIRNFVTCKLVV